MEGHRGLVVGGGDCELGVKGEMGRRAQGAGVTLTLNVKTSSLMWAGNEVSSNSKRLR
ncbi:hypothetical protein GALMADRAFT_565911 [Galerina marginata CBS 339.88]|uniref:Uncharacterized protein n=1 Tax=Galerina marginata (strain CBS 339.88) TaxID=685588 RepID=A0A067SVB5_GALM3|nr:hypothetical protein GALMADRAFT_565911 [Galerina marginata CBS 339.88]